MSQDSELRRQAELLWSDEASGRWLDRRQVLALRREAVADRSTDPSAGLEAGNRLPQEAVARSLALLADRTVGDALLDSAPESLVHFGQWLDRLLALVEQAREPTPPRAELAAAADRVAVRLARLQAALAARPD